MMRGAAAHNPALARERARLGAMRGGALCTCREQHARTMMGIGDLSTSQFSAALQTKLSAAGAAAQGEIASATGYGTATQATAAKGAASAVGLLQNGYNPDSQSDNANLIHAIAGGLALVPGAGPILAGAVEALWLVGNAIACPVAGAFASIGLGTGCGVGCKTSGNWTAASILAGNKGALPAMPKGSFASLVVPALATYAAQNNNCKGGFPAAVIVDGVVALWNETHAGPAAAYYVPSLLVQPGTEAPTGTMLLAGAGSHVSGNTPAARAGQVPNIYYAFGPAAALSSFLGLDVTKPSGAFGGWMQYIGASSLPGTTTTTPRTVMVNTGALLPQASTAAPVKKKTLNLHVAAPATGATARAKAGAAPMSTGAKVAVGAAAAGGASLALWLAANGWKWVTPRWAKPLVR